MGSVGRARYGKANLPGSATVTFGRLDFYVGVPCARILGGQVREPGCARPQAGVTISGVAARAVAEFLARGRRNHPRR